MASRFTRSDPRQRAKLFEGLAKGILFPQEVLGPLMDSYELEDLERQIAADPQELNEWLQRLLDETRVDRLPVFLFGSGPSDEDRAAWEAERWDVYQALLTAFGLTGGGS